MRWESLAQVLVSTAAILIYEIVAICILSGLVIYMLKMRKKRKREILAYWESEKKAVLDKALTNEKRGGVL